MSRKDTPHLDAARADGEILLCTMLISYTGSDERAERLLSELFEVYEKSADFEPNLPPEARTRAVRRAALVDAVGLREGGIIS